VLETRHRRNERFNSLWAIFDNLDQFSDRPAMYPHIADATFDDQLVAGFPASEGF